MLSDAHLKHSCRQVATVRCEQLCSSNDDQAQAHGQPKCPAQVVSHVTSLHCIQVRSYTHQDHEGVLMVFKAHDLSYPRIIFWMPVSVFSMVGSWPPTSTNRDTCHIERSFEAVQYATTSEFLSWHTDNKQAHIDKTLLPSLNKPQLAKPAKTPSKPAAKPSWRRS